MDPQNVNINIVNLQFSLESKFKAISENMKQLTVKIDNETQLKFYGLFKVATVGKFPENTKTPWGIVEKLKKYYYN